MTSLPTIALLLVLLASTACSSQRQVDGSDPGRASAPGHATDAPPTAARAPGSDPLGDPAAAPVPLDAADGWQARLLHANDVGVWTVGLADVLPRYAGPEVVALDDLGRVTILSSYAGKTYAYHAVWDGTWLGGLAFGDVDARRDGPELYVGAQRGNLYQIVALPQGGFETRVLAYFPGREVHSLAVLTGTPGRLLAGLSDGAVHELLPPETDGAPWTPVLRHEDPGRIRQIVPLPDGGCVFASRSGNLVALDADFAPTLLHHAAGGLARLALGRAAENGAPVVWAIGDAGDVVRAGWDAQGRPDSSVVHHGPVGGRGIVAAPLAADPGRETVAIFGYSGDVELLTPDGAGHWHAETLFTDIDKGHWLAAGELDDRNGTAELVLSGYAGRVVLLARPPGFGLSESGTPSP